MKIASTMLAVAFLAFGCTAPLTPVTTNEPPSPVAEAGLFSQLGLSAGRACKLSLTGNQQEAQRTLQAAGFALSETTGRNDFYAKALPEYRAGLTRVTVGLPTKPDLVGTLNCIARVSPVAKPQGDLFFSAFQAGGRSANHEIQVPAYGRFEATYSQVVIYMSLIRSRQGT